MLLCCCSIVYDYNCLCHSKGVAVLGTDPVLFVWVQIEDDLGLLFVIFEILIVLKPVRVNAGSHEVSCLSRLCRSLGAYSIFIAIRALMLHARLLLELLLGSKDIQVSDLRRQPSQAFIGSGVRSAYLLLTEHREVVMLHLLRVKSDPSNPWVELMLDANHITQHSQQDCQDCIFVLLLHVFILEENVADMADCHVVRPG